MQLFVTCNIIEKNSINFFLQNIFTSKSFLLSIEKEILITFMLFNNDVKNYFATSIFCIIKIYLFNILNEAPEKYIVLK